MPQPDHVSGSNARVRVRGIEVLAEDWSSLRKVTFDLQGTDGRWRTQQREVYDRGNGATALLHDPDRNTIVLTRQFRIPAFLNAHPDGMLVETPAGLLEREDPATAMRRELEEETGYTVTELIELFDIYMSPGSITERVVFFYGTYSPDAKTSAGGGDRREGEEVEVLEVPLADAAAMITAGEIRDGKTIMLIQWALLNLDQIGS